MRHGTPPPHPRRRLAACVALLAAAGGCAPEAPPRPPVVLVVVDTVRADRWSGGASPRPTTPALDERLSEAAVFARAFAPSAWTLPSCASILTGLWPARHGAGRAGGGDGGWLPLRSGVPTLAETLRDAGYATGAVVNNPFLQPELGLDRGFGHYDASLATNTRIRRADETVRAALDWIDGRGDEPFFLLVHVMDPHMSYDPPPAVRGRFTSAVPSSWRLPVQDLRGLRASAAEVAEPDREFVRAAYDEELAFVDRELGRLIEGLGRRGVLERGLLVVTSDHGEELFDHGSFEHGHSLFQEILHVPLAFLGRGVRPGRRAAPVSLVDLAPTLAEAAGVSAPAADGHSLWGAVAEGAPLPARPLFAQGLLYGDEQRAVIDWPHKLIIRPLQREAMLYDLERDPGERTNVGAGRPELFRRLLGELERAGGDGRPARTAATLEEGTHEALEALGYTDG